MTGWYFCCPVLPHNPRLVGAELWDLRHYDGIWSRCTGDAVYLGPTLYVQFSPKVFVRVEYADNGYDVDVPGSNLNLAEFSRQRGKLKLAVEF